MVRVEWHNDARNDLIQVYSYIYQDSIHYAIKTIDEIAKLADTLAILPYIGRKIPEYDVQNKRELIYKSYRIMYKIESNTVVIHRIWHSARQMPKRLIS